jgi:hypothetical protein
MVNVLEGFQRKKKENMNGIFIVVSFIIRLIMGALGAFVFVKLYVHMYAADFLFKDALGWVLGFELLRAHGVVQRFLRDINVAINSKSQPDLVLSIICSNCIAAILVYPAIIVMMVFVHWVFQ